MNVDLPLPGEEKLPDDRKCIPTLFRIDSRKATCHRGLNTVPGLNSLFFIFLWDFSKATQKIYVLLIGLF